MGIYIAWKQRQSEFSIDSCTSSGYNNAYESISITNVNNSIFYDHNDYNKRIFFDDLPNNIYAAHNMGWETVWIHREADNNNKPYYTDHAYTNIVEALQNIDLN